MIARYKEGTSLAEFMVLPDDGNLHEFVRGEIRVSPPPKGRHGRVEVAVTSALDRYLDDKARALGWEPAQGIEARDRLVGFVAGGEFGIHFTLPDDPNQTRGVDAAFVPPEQYAHVEWDNESYFPEVPALVVEVISPSDEKADVEEKRRDCLVGGARRVWSVYAKHKEIHVHAPHAPTRVLRLDDTLTDDDLLPGFALPLQLVFPTR